MKIYVHNYVEPLVINSDLYEEKHAAEIGNAFDLDQHHYLSDINLDYWIWKNSKEDIIGKIQYRKWFLNAQKEKYYETQIENVLKSHDIMLSITKANINGKPCQNILNYCWYHASFDIRLANKLVEDKYKLGQAFYDYLNNTDILVYANLYIAKREVIIKYYDWVFPILEEFCKQSAFRSYPDHYQQRAPGYIAERLFSFWCLHSNLKIYETDINAEESAKDKDTKLIRFSCP